MRNTSQTSTYTHFRKNKHHQHAQNQLGLSLHEIDQLTKQLDILTLNSKKLQDSRRRADRNIDDCEAFSHEGHGLKLDHLHGIDDTNNFQSQPQSPLFSKHRPGSNLRHSRTNSMEFHENGSHKYCSQHNISSPLTDRNNPPSPSLLLSLKSEQLQHNSLMSTSNSVTVGKLSSQLSEQIVDKLVLLRDRIPTKNIGGENFCQILEKLGEIEEIINLSEQF